MRFTVLPTREGRPSRSGEAEHCEPERKGSSDARGASDHRIRKGLAPSRAKLWRCNLLTMSVQFSAKILD